MSDRHIPTWSQGLRMAMPMLLLLASLSANAGLFGFGGTSWQEEVLLHDGSKVVVERAQRHGGRHEIGQSSPVSEHTITFTLPGSNKAIKWTSEYGEDLGRTNFNLLALHILAGTPYLLTEPNLCLSYNKWGRPNPPYVIFKYVTDAWQRIPLSDLPAEFKTINLIVNNGREEHIHEAAKQLGYVSAESVLAFNGSLTQPQYKTILREAMKNPEAGCGEMIYDGNGGWTGIGWFKNQPNSEACLRYCELQKMSAKYCPCESIFGKK